MNDLTIRDADPGDEAGWRALWDAYLAFYAVDLARGVTDRTWAQLMDPASPLKARVAVQAGRLAGFAHVGVEVRTQDR